MNGIDISNNNAGNGFDISQVLPHVDFAIMKATGGDFFVDAFCDGWVQQCINAGKPWGFYHFAGDGDSASAANEASWFLSHARNYFGKGIPVLDWENSYGVDWVNEFVRIIYRETGIWCWIYGNPWRFNQGGVEPNCGRWIADYPPVERPSLRYNPGETPYADGLVCAWQFASDGVVPGREDLFFDVNEFYGDSDTWALYAGSATLPVEPLPEVPPTGSEETVLFNDGKHTIVLREG